MPTDVKIKRNDGTWVSIVGPEGPAGPAGEDGADGQQGPEGPAGRSMQVFEGASEPGAALPGDVWITP